MIFWASSETFGPAYETTLRARLVIEEYFKAELEKSNLRDFEAKFRYVPIVMPINMHKKYTERSKLRKKQRIVDCAPQLHFETFVSGTFKDQLTEYARGIGTCTHMLAGLGATEDQVHAFERILAWAVDTILEKTGGQTRD